MKNFLHPIYVFLGILLITITSCSSSKNAATKSTAFINLIENQQYTFVAQNVIPTEDARFNVRFMFPQATSLYQLNSRYDLRISKDSVEAYLPFFGRAFMAPMDPTKGGFKFISTKFDYKIAIRKKTYQVTISPKDVPDVRSIYVSLSPSGYASLQILSINRTPISFNGMIEANK